MKKRIFNKNSFIKKKFAQIARLFGYELVNQASFTLVSSNQSLEESTSVPGKKSISIPLGELNIKKKINKVLIILRTCTSELVMDQNKERVFEKTKKEYTFRTLKSLTSNIHFAKDKIKNLELELIITDTNSFKEDLETIQSMLNKINARCELRQLNLDNFKNDIIGDYSKAKFSNMANFLSSLKISNNTNADLVFFLEDDYVLKENCLFEMIMSYEKFYTLFDKEIVLLPADYPYLYSSNESSEIFIGEKNHWRKVNESLVTFMTSPNLIKANYDPLIKMATFWEDPWEKPLHEIYKKTPCLSPVPSLSMHCANINSVFGIPPNYDWEKEWEKNKLDD